MNLYLDMTFIKISGDIFTLLCQNTKVARPFRFVGLAWSRKSWDLRSRVQIYIMPQYKRLKEKHQLCKSQSMMDVKVRKISNIKLVLVFSNKGLPLMLSSTINKIASSCIRKALINWRERSLWLTVQSRKLYRVIILYMI